MAMAAAAVQANIDDEFHNYHALIAGAIGHCSTLTTSSPTQIAMVSISSRSPASPRRSRVTNADDLGEKPMVRELNKIPTLAWWIAEVILCVAVYCLLEGQAIIFGSLPTWVAAASIAGFVTIVAVLVLTKQYKYVYMPFLLVGVCAFRLVLQTLCLSQQRLRGLLQCQRLPSLAPSLHGQCPPFSCWAPLRQSPRIPCCFLPRNVPAPPKGMP
ncbi:hypothetical protein [Cupriavidus sp. EM10]|uniref:hypothetical protein n=1 Tax=Cupriavidus sp. EM10 TaxID=2839983 RepID=UPI001C00593E|nr:hypothetical protein [Cupriavidus sp. EM10]QWE98056.1 hypothetical protein KLP38_29670 [Cupriavidus sp. EM10]